MTDPRDPNDPVYRNTADESLEDKSNRWGVIVGVVFLMIVARVALGFGHKPGQLGSNDTKPPATPLSTPPGNPTMVPTSPAASRRP